MHIANTNYDSSFPTLGVFEKRHFKMSFFKMETSYKSKTIRENSITVFKVITVSIVFVPL